MRFVPVKSQDEQARLCIHRVRQGFVEPRTATINRLRGLLSEFGIVLAQKVATVRPGGSAGLGQHRSGGPSDARDKALESLSGTWRLWRRELSANETIMLSAAEPGCTVRARSQPHSCA
jgi:hypothetical protein